MKKHFPQKLPASLFLVLFSIIWTLGVQAQPMILNIEHDVDIEEDVTLYPNPVRTELNIHISTDINLDKIQIFNLSGELIEDIELAGESLPKTLHLDLEPGTYLFNVYASDAPLAIATIAIVFLGIGAF